MRPDALFAIEDWMRRNNIAQHLPEPEREQVAIELLERLDDEVRNNWDDYPLRHPPEGSLLEACIRRERERYRRDLIHSITDQLEQLGGDDT